MIVSNNQLQMQLEQQHQMLHEKLMRNGPIFHIWIQSFVVIDYVATENSSYWKQNTKKVWKSVANVVLQAAAAAAVDKSSHNNSILNFKFETLYIIWWKTRLTQTDYTVLLNAMKFTSQFTFALINLKLM